MKQYLIVIFFLVSCRSDDYMDCEKAFDNIYSQGFCDNCETFSGQRVKINFLEKDTSVFKYDIYDSIVFLFQDSVKKQDTVIYICTYNESFLGPALPSAHISRCINVLDADNKEFIFTPNKPNHDLLKVRLVAHHNGGVFFVSFLNSKIEAGLQNFESPNLSLFFDTFIYNSTVYNSVSLFKTKDLNSKSVNFYLNIENNFCLISKEDSSFYQRIN